MVTIVGSITTPETARFSGLHIRIQESARSLLTRCLEPTKELVHTLIQMETARINTSHPDFLGSRSAVSGLISEIKVSAFFPTQPNSHQNDAKLDVEKKKKEFEKAQEAADRRDAQSTLAANNTAQAAMVCRKHREIY